ncbi:MAG: hypothetical protein ACD_46C00172G0002 [uncultured bacterium]|nr:MAG: hypothetical protein ACD_46C00172G0002 [uncultured bacterium]
MKITRLKDHNILKTASAVSREYIAKCNPDESGSEPSATKRESYAIEVLLATGNVVSCIDQLYFSIDMLSGYRANNAAEKMNRYDYVVYGIENYYLRLTSVFDRCLRLANVIFQLGLPERQYNNESIIKNAHVKGTAVASALTELNKFTDPFRFHRNTVAHQSTYSEKDLDQLGSYYYLAEEDDGFERYRYIFKKKTDDFVSEKKKGFNDHVVKLERLVEIYLDSVVSILEARLKAYV